MAESNSALHDGEFTPLKAADVASSEHPFITARHADNIVEAAKKLGADIRDDGEKRQHQHLEILALHTAQVAEMRGIRDDLKKLLDVLVPAALNGDAAKYATTEEGDTP
jgi:hypothetical protein